MFDERITYEVLEDGTCSYCGREADWIELPDGGLTRSDICIPCDYCNVELDFEEWWSSPYSGDAQELCP